MTDNTLERLWRDSGIAALRKLTKERRDNLIAERYWVMLSKRNGATWADIGEALGISKQSAHRRYSALWLVDARSGREETSEYTD
jgi:DNA-directed RNA polymerase sigma subunit (sigma70/sigma32)